MGRRTILLIAAVLVAGLGSALVFGYVNSLRSAVAADLEDVEVLVVTEPIEAGTSVADAERLGSFQKTVLTNESVADGALGDLEPIRDLVALAPIFPGEQVLSQKFGESSAVSRLTLPKDKLAVSVQLSDPARVAGFVNPGSTVAVMLTTDPNERSAGFGSTSVPETRVLLPRVEVIAVGQSSLVAQRTTAEDGSQTVEEIPRAILTLALDQDQAQRVVFGQTQGELYLALLGDKASVTTDETTTALNLFTP